MNNVKQLLKRIFLRGKIELLTGMHIGGTESGISIGGVDSVVIREPINNTPYIPGSSLKGKMRSLLEKMRGEYEKDKEGNFGPSKSSDKLSSKIFGISADDSNEDSLKASRLIVRDSFLTEESLNKLSEADLELPYTEVKTETSIDRISSRANPRQIERVPKGAEFSFEMILNIFKDDKENELLEGVLTSMLLLQEDYIGGHGSRGSGKIKFKNLKLTYKDKKIYESGEDEKNYESQDGLQNMINKLKL